MKTNNSNQDDRYRLLNGRDVARRLGVSDWFIQGIRRAGAFHGDSPFVGDGRFSRMEWIDEWLRKHPEFSAARYLPQRPRKKKASKAPSSRRRPGKKGDRRRSGGERDAA